MIRRSIDAGKALDKLNVEPYAWKVRNTKDDDIVIEPVKKDHVYIERRGERIAQGRLNAQIALENSFSEIQAFYLDENNKWNPIDE